MFQHKFVKMTTNPSDKRAAYPTSTKLEQGRTEQSLSAAERARLEEQLRMERAKEEQLTHYLMVSEKCKAS